MAKCNCNIYYVTVVAVGINFWTKTMDQTIIDCCATDHRYECSKVSLKMDYVFFYLVGIKYLFKISSSLLDKKIMLVT